MNPTAILALVGDLYAQITALQAENTQLKKQVEGQPSSEG